MNFYTKWIQSGIFGYPSTLCWIFIALVCFSIPLNSLFAQGRTITADIAVLEQPIILNRMGSSIPDGTLYALMSDVMVNPANSSGGLVAGNVMLRPDKRPRPLVLRANKGDTIIVRLTNFLTPQRGDASLPKVGFSVNGMQYVEGTIDNGSWIGADADNQSSPEVTVTPNETKVYTLLAEEEGSFLMRDPSSTITSWLGLFGSVTVQPEQAEWYRSQVTNEDLYYATDRWIGENGNTITKQDAIQNGQVVDNQVVETIGYPVINYQAKFPAQHPDAGTYVLRMLDDANNIIYSDLTAIITGPNNGRFLDSQTGPLFDSIPASPDRRQPYREICIHYHNPLTATQAFADTLSDLPANTLEGTDIFGINYASAGIVNEIAANRFEVGPMADCVECKYEEFFLSSWSAGDPAMVPNVDATTSLMNKAHPQAEYVKYADDPSNVYHAYLWDHTKMRINHANPLITHVHHFHAHQWLHSPNDASGHYLDSQTINPGASWSLELVHNGAGNKNLTPGDNIFHCHFYPHFASGMWGLFRVHDVLELGTRVDGTTPVAGSRAYPDGEIMTGTPIPALVPLPTKAMAPVPAPVEIIQGQVVLSEDDKNPGYPFFIPGIAGSRPPHPPLDFATEGTGINKQTLDGGLPRHILKGGEIVWEQHTTTDWTKDIDTLVAIKLPEEGTSVEKAAMRFHERLSHSTYRPDNGNVSSFRTNGQPRASGAPFANPAEDIDGNQQGTKRTYKAANIQMDVVLNKQGWHFPQQRMITLWEDVAPTIDGTRPPEPFFFRANSFEFIEFWHTNLVPDYYELDDFQVRTPTDVLGQHIHLVKFDVTASDGAANGFNYEDGTFSPNEVRERIKGINNGTFLNYDFRRGTSLKNSNLGVISDSLIAKSPNPIWGKAPVNQNWAGAQTTIQRWYADPLYDLENRDRTIRTVFTHDHFSPSTHQQIGLYAGLLVEPANSTWHNAETGEELGNRSDGGPTSFQAIIKNKDKINCSYREFALEFQDLAMAYTADSKAFLSPYPEYQPPSSGNKYRSFTDSVGNYTGWRDPVHAIAPPPGPQVIAVQGGDPLLFSNYSLNYRNEPLTLRASQATPYSLGNYAQTPGLGGDLAYIYSSDPTIANERGYESFSKQPELGSKISPYNNFTFPKNHLTPGMEPGDPYTPLLRVYENDKVQIRTLVGAHEVPHIFNIHGLPWLFEPSAINSGYRSTQMMSISEHFEMNFTIPGNTAGANGVTDYLYNASSDNNGLNTGLWGLIRAYPKKSDPESLAYVPSNKERTPTIQASGCPKDRRIAPVREFEVGAYLVDQLTNGQALVYNSMDTIFDQHAMVFIKEKEIFGGTTVFERGPSVEFIDPMVLRARAGECIQVNLTNHIDTSNSEFEELVEIGFKNQLALGRELNVHVTASGHVGLHPELLSYHSNDSDGANIGLNDVQTASPNGGTASYSWYAGKWKKGRPVPVEFGSVLLTSADPMEQYARGLFGAVIVEPKDAVWNTDRFNPTAATVLFNGGNDQFREFVIFHQDNLLLSTTVDGNNKRDTVAVGGGATVGINYKTAPFAYRYFTNNQVQNQDAQGKPLPPDIHAATANDLVFADPTTPVFAAGAGTPIRIRLIKPGGPGDPETFILDGHIWQEEPYKDSSTVLGYNPNSQWLGSRPQLAALNNFDLLIESAGGESGITGDYKYFPYFSAPFEGGAWGLVRVTDGKDAITLTRAEESGDGTTFDLYATTTVDVSNGAFKENLTLTSGIISNVANSLGYAGNGTKSWKFSNIPASLLTNTSGITVQSGQDGSQITVDSDKLNSLIPSGEVRPRAIPNDSFYRLQNFLENQPFNRPNRTKSDRK